MSDRITCLRKRLAAELRAMGAVRSADWQHALEQVPRHVFVPRFTLGSSEAGTPDTVDAALPEQHEEWLTSVYSDTGLVTQFGEDGHSTSSSSTPSTMAWMLEALDVSPGQRVLEIGTGSGYNAALLSERLGADRVTTVDIDPELVELARERLRSAGYTPTVAVADGTTASLRMPPTTW
jgi:protein-L-isoaspartate O-methyltransferase